MFPRAQAARTASALFQQQRRKFAQAATQPEAQNEFAELEKAAFVPGHTYVDNFGARHYTIPIVFCSLIGGYFYFASGKKSLLYPEEKLMLTKDIASGLRSLDGEIIQPTHLHY